MNSEQSGLEIDLETFQVRRDGELIPLTQTEWMLLRVLIQHKNRPVPQKALLKAAWGDLYGINSSHLYNGIASIRKKIGDSPKNPKRLITLPKHGYQWVESEDVHTPAQFGSPNKHASRKVIPAPLTAFIGRERELALLERKLRKSDVRLLTITGPGGIGKTRLVFELVRRMNTDHPFSDGFHFVDLAPVNAPEFVIGGIAHALGLREKAVEDPLSAIKRHLHDKNLLLILDNFEHVTAAADEILEILTSVHGLKILITSRERLRLYGEHNLELAPLPLAESIQSTNGWISEAVLLYIERAQAIDPYFELTLENASILQQICERLDGLPLAIELAAVMHDRLAPSALLERLDRRLQLLVDGQRNLPHRHQTLRATIDWSYELLDEPERRLLGSLSIFNGSFTPDAAKVVCSNDAIPAVQISEKLKLLRHKSLLSLAADAALDEVRYVMLNTLREYAADLLSTSEASELGRRHANYYLSLLDAHNIEFDVQTHKSISLDLGNLRIAMKWAIANNADETALRLSTGMYDLWQHLGMFREGKQWLFDALDAAGELPTPLRARALYCAGALADWLGEHQKAQRMYRESLRLYEMLEDEPGITHGLLILGSALINQGDFVEGRSLSEQSLSMAREQEDSVGVERALNNLGMIAIYQGDAPKARSIYDEMLSQCESRKNAQGKAWALTGLSWTVLLQGDYAAAQQLITESLALHQQSTDVLGMALALTCDSWIAVYRADFDEAITKLQNSLKVCQEVGLANLSIWPLTGLARISLYRGDLQQARSLLNEAVRLCEVLNFPPVTAWVYLALGIKYRMSGQYDGAFDEFDRALTLSHKRDDRNALTAALEQFAVLFVAQERPDVAVQLFGTAAQRREAHSLPLSKFDHLEYDEVVCRLQTEKPADWETNWLKGRSLIWDEITELIYNRPNKSIQR